MGKYPAVRSKKIITDCKLSILLSAFRGKETLSISDICSLLKCNRQSAYNYISRLKENGFQFKQTNIKHKAYYSLVSSSLVQAESTAAFMPVTAKTLRKYMILQKLQGNIMEMSELKKSILPENKQAADFEPDNPDQMDISKTSYYNLVNELLAEGEIEEREGLLIPTGKSMPLILNIDAEHFDDIFDTLPHVAQGHPYYTQLNSIYQKVRQLCGFDVDSPSYLTYGRKYTEINNINERLEKIEKYDYKNRVLQIKYTPKEGMPVSLPFFATGMIVYCLEKDVIYILGYNNSENENNLPYTIIDISTIKHIEMTSIKNEYYLSKIFKEMFDNMFSISIEPAIKVKVEFSYSDTIWKELSYLAKKRSTNSNIQKCNNTIIYTDKVSGLNDFANYLRCFGENVIHAEPDELKKKMEFTIERTLCRYSKLEAADNE